MPDIKNLEAALGLSKDKSKLLNLTFGTSNITPGDYLPKRQAQSAPQISFNQAVGTYIVIGIDLDAPLRILGPALHWIQSGLEPKNTTNGTTNLDASNTPFIVDYAAPGPPPGSSPHRYIFLLYEQPKGFDIAKFASPGGKKVGIMPRIRFDIKAFEKEAMLGPIIASNYFLSN